MTTAYAGTELEIFQHATNWKAYYGRLLAPFLGRHVLEVGAGLGATTGALVTSAQESWVCLEPDAAMAAMIGKSIVEGRLPPHCQAMAGTTEDFSQAPLFDTVLYLDVLEHIADDRGELARAARLLRSGGHLIVLVPAHQALFTPFDKAIGHHRRYDRRLLETVMPQHLERVLSKYLDSAGTLLSLGNKLLLRTATPTLRQIEIWDRFVIPISRVLDPLLRYRVGKSLLDVRRSVRV